MSTLRKITRVLEQIVDEVTKPQSFQQGEDFENYVRKYMFPQRDYDLIHRTRDYASNHRDFAESSLLPDFQFRDKRTKNEFFVECKFRSGLLSEEDKLEWCNYEQLKRYKAIDAKTPVIIALGIGPEGSDPDNLCLFPLASTKWTGLYPSFLNSNAFYLKKPVFSGYLQQMIGKKKFRGGF